MKNNKFPLSPLAYAVCLAAGYNSAYAASDTPALAEVFEEIVVTASRSRERVFDSHAALSIITEEDMARATLPSLAELMRDVPGVQVTDSGQPGLGRIRIRGEESRRTAILINSQEVTDHYEVGTPLTLQPAMVERVEVLRGSGAVLYGSRALSGVVNFITRKGGTEPLQATLSGGYNSATEGYDTFASVYGNVQGFEYRLAWSKSDQEDRSTPAGTIENTSFDNESLYLFAGRSFGDHRVEYTYEDYESSSHVFVEEELKTTFPLTDFYLETPQRDRQKHGVFYEWDADSNWLNSVSANAFHQVSDRHFYTATDTVWYTRDINSISDLTSDGALAQLNFQPLGGHQFIAGLQYLKDDVDQTRHVDTVAWAPPYFTGIEIIQDKANIETLAWFVQDQWEITNSLSLTAGLRQYFVEGELEYSDRDSLTQGSLNDDDELIGSLGLSWSVNDNLRLRANVSEGYVYPSLSQLATGAYAGSRFVNPDPGLTPETSVNYELGMRMQLSGVVLDATAFYTSSDDYIHHLPCAEEDACPGSRDRKYKNIGESEAQGLELYLTYRPEAWGIEPYTSLTWMKRRNIYEQFSTWDSGIPEVSGRLGLRWEGVVMSAPNVWTDFYLRGESSSDLKEPGTSRAVLEDKTGWVTLNASSGFEFGQDARYQVALELFNLTDKKYIASSENLYGAERSVAVKFTVNI
jgi:hemoglobin/transferrin/lactoferrin receptor protein